MNKPIFVFTLGMIVNKDKCDYGRVKCPQNQAMFYKTNNFFYETKVTDVNEISETYGKNRSILMSYWKLIIRFNIHRIPFIAKLVSLCLMI